MSEEFHYLTGAARFKDGFVDELAVYPLLAESPELEAVGHMVQDYVESASTIISQIKEGYRFAAMFDGSDRQFLVEIVMREGRESLEVADVGQPAEFKTLRNLPLPGGE